MTTLERVRAEIQKVLDTERDFTSENAKAQALALSWVLELFDKYAEQEPCDDVVSRQAVIAEINDTIAEYIPIFYGRTVKIPLELDRAIMRVPPVRPQEQTGHWIRCDILQEFKCSECRVCFRHKTNYCPNCGAKMVEPQESEDKE